MSKFAVGEIALTYRSRGKREGTPNMEVEVRSNLTQFTPSIKSAYKIHIPGIPSPASHKLWIIEEKDLFKKKRPDDDISRDTEMDKKVPWSGLVDEDGHQIYTPVKEKTDA